MSTPTAGLLVFGFVAGPPIVITIAWWVSRRKGPKLPPGPDTVTAHRDDPLGYAETEAGVRGLKGPPL